AGLDMSYEQLVRDFSRGTYSSQRQGMLEDRRGWKAEQDLLIDTVVGPVYRLFIACAFAEGKFADLVDIREFFANPSRFTEAEYIPDGHEWIDPLKEATGFEKLIALRLVTRKELIAGRGGRMRNTFQQIHDEKRLSKELDIAFPEDVAAQASMLKGAVIPPGSSGGGPAPGAPLIPPAPGGAPAAMRDDDEIDWDGDSDFEPDFDNETVGEPTQALLPQFAAPITIAGKGFGSPSDAFGPHDVFDNPQHAAPGDALRALPDPDGAVAVMLSGDDEPVDHWVTIDGQPVPITSGGGGGSGGGKGSAGLSEKTRAAIEQHTEAHAAKFGAAHTRAVLKNEQKFTQHEVRKAEKLLKGDPNHKPYQQMVKSAHARAAAISHALGHAFTLGK
ncbi:MAG TPA: phage portal protein, partial [Isosphaeraceae bacterium]|nr:phage portal protein [Isosphaeraceae bacterium]